MDIRLERLGVLDLVSAISSVELRLEQRRVRVDVSGAGLQRVQTAGPMQSTRLPCADERNAVDSEPQRPRTSAESVMLEADATQRH